jgi:LysR family glycine cleavage system transcriptional activator
MSLPSLNALQAFEAAARHASFTRAGAELGVTQTAISHQVKALEGELGVSLFRRSPRRLTLTGEGQAWAAELRPIFQRLRDASARLRATTRAQRPVVAVTTIPSFGARWLVPRLGRFLAQNPAVDVHISPSALLTDFGVEPFDVGIRWGRGRYPGLACQLLAEDAWVVVSAPAAIDKLRLKTPRELLAVPLLADDHPSGWSDWFAACRVRGRPTTTSRFTDSSMLVEAATRGQGIALARWSLAFDELAAGRLVQVFPRVPLLRTQDSYFVVGPRESFRKPHVAAFRDWVLKEAQALRGRLTTSSPGR